MNDDPYVPTKLVGKLTPITHPHGFDRYHLPSMARAWGSHVGRQLMMREVEVIRGVYEQGWRDGVGRSGVLVRVDPHIMFGAVLASSEEAEWPDDAIKRIRELRGTGIAMLDEQKVRAALWPGR